MQGRVHGPHNLHLLSPVPIKRNSLLLNDSYEAKHVCSPCKVSFNTVHAQLLDKSLSSYPSMLQFPGSTPELWSHHTAADRSPKRQCWPWPPNTLFHCFTLPAGSPICLQIPHSPITDKCFLELSLASRKDFSSLLMIPLYSMHGDRCLLGVLDTKILRGRDFGDILYSLRWT